jgi:hypothetical protein
MVCILWAYEWLTNKGTLSNLDNKMPGLSFTKTQARATKLLPKTGTQQLQQ